MEKLFNGIYKNRKVLVTGHTGFKGSWLVYWLTKMGAEVLGYSLDAPTDPNHISKIDAEFTSIIGDIRDAEKLNKTFEDFKPEIVFHLAAQPLVRDSYDNPVDTYTINVIGTLNVYEAARKTDGVKAIVSITTDKVYENNEWLWGYREIDPLGGYDPYSASKACDEIMSISYQRSFFNINDYKTKHNTLLSTVRAGNVIGGGDWAKDRLICDIIRAVSEGEHVYIRNPYSTRPWQHVLEPLSGYLLVGQKLLEEKKEFATPYNFGPYEEGSVDVRTVVERVKKYWDDIDYEINESAENPHEAGLLKLDITKANNDLGWVPIWDSETTFKMTVEWYKNYYKNSEVHTEDNLNQFVIDAKRKGLLWAKES